MRVRFEDRSHWPSLAERIHEALHRQRGRWLILMYRLKRVDAFLITTNLTIDQPAICAKSDSDNPSLCFIQRILRFFAPFLLLFFRRRRIENEQYDDKCRIRPELTRIHPAGFAIKVTSSSNLLRNCR